MMNIPVFANYASQQTVDGYIIDFFNTGFNGAVPEAFGNFLLILLSLAIACIFGGIIGFEREIHGHAAGFRTHILISVGSALIMIISGYATADGADPMRLAAAGVTGAGFLGAGSIIQNGFNVKGLTTAASIWVTVAVGMCVGAGYFIIGLVATFLTFLCLGLFRKLEAITNKRNRTILVVASSDQPVLAMVLEIADKHEITIKDVTSSLIKQDDKQYLRIVFKFLTYKKDLVALFMDELKEHINAEELRLLH